MTFLPIVERELRVRARLKSTHRLRLIAAGLAILIVGGLLLLSAGRGSGGSFGAGTFYTLAGLVFAYCLLEGLRNTADCLSEEKRAGTLGLLFLTDLRGYDVVLGKLIATSLNSFYALLAVLPPMAIPLIIGGVTAGEFWRAVLALVNALFFSLTAGLAVSAASRDERKAWGGTLALVAFFCVLPPALQSVTYLPALFQLPISPTIAFMGSFDAAYTADPGRYWSALWSIHLLSWGLLITASVVLPRSWHDRPATFTGSWWQRLHFGKKDGELAAQRDTARRLAVLEVNPVVWLVSRGERERMSLWTIVVVAAGLVAGVWVMAQGSKVVAIALFAALLLLHLGLSLWVASEACHLFADARDSGALEVLLCTPMSIREILQGYLLGLRRLFYRPVLILVAVEVLLIAGQAFVMAATASRLEIIFTVLGAGLCIFIAVLDLFAVARYGMWAGLSTKKPGRAVTKTVVNVLLLPMLALLLCLPLWPIIGVVKNLIFMNYAQEQLRRYFRAVITERYGLGEESEITGAPSRRAVTSQMPRVT